MERLGDKLILLICCSIFYTLQSTNPYLVVTIIVSIIISCLMILLQPLKFTITIFMLYFISCFFMIDLLYFLPLIAYALFDEQKEIFVFMAIIPAALRFQSLSPLALCLVTFLCIVSFLLARRTNKIETLKKQYYSLRDDMTEDANSLALKNKDLMERQDYEINVATLNERNRIAREIHDTVGHVITSSLVQIGALSVISKDELTKEYLNNIKETLSTGMDSIRHSIHNIHEDSLDLETKVKSLIDEFAFCPVTFEYDVTNDFSVKVKYSLISIIKESLNNTMKHSNATSVSVSIIEQPGFYQIILADNGTTAMKATKSGMGILSISERINSLDGTINITKNNGFRIFITLPKEVS